MQCVCVCVCLFVCVIGNRHVHRHKTDSLLLLWPSCILCYVLLVVCSALNLIVNSCFKKKTVDMDQSFNTRGHTGRWSLECNPAWIFTHRLPFVWTCVKLPLCVSELTASFGSFCCFLHKSIGFGIIWYFIFSVHSQNKLSDSQLEPKHGSRLNYRPGRTVFLDCGITKKYVFSTSSFKCVLSTFWNM